VEKADQQRHSLARKSSSALFIRRVGEKLGSGIRIQDPVSSQGLIVNTRASNKERLSEGTGGP